AAFAPARGWTAEESGGRAAGGRLLVISDDFGFALVSLAADEADLLTLAVAPERWGRGVGAALLEAALREAAEGGAATMHLEVAADNLAAISLYRAAGFVETGRRPRYYARGAARIDAMLFARPTG
ncbi:MAG: GNAT family N-acetyltransferase, partial [Paracoccaceae bacterium]